MKCYVVFIIQKPDARTYKPFKEINTQFATALKEAVEKGVGIKAIYTRFRPPNFYLRGSLPVKLT